MIAIEMQRWRMRWTKLLGSSRFFFASQLCGCQLNEMRVMCGECRMNEYFTGYYYFSAANFFSLSLSHCLCFLFFFLYSIGCQMVVGKPENSKSKFQEINCQTNWIWCESCELNTYYMYRSAWHGILSRTEHRSFQALPHPLRNTAYIHFLVV